MRKHARRLVLLLALGSAGCGALDRVNDALYETGAFDVEPSAGRAVARDCSVRVVSRAGCGRGVVVGETTVLTVAHVVGDDDAPQVATSSLAWTTAKVARRIPGSPEDVVELELPRGTGLLAFEGFAAERRAPLGAGSPAWVLTGDGVHGWNHGLRRGDSGSPVLDREGTVVGLLVGVTTGGGAVLTPTTRAGLAGDRLLCLTGTRNR